MEKIRSLINKANLTREQILALVSFFATIITTFGLAKIFNVSLQSAGPLMLILVLSILFLITWVLAGMIILKSLFLVSGELSLMIFLAQSYCDVKNRTQASDGALISLFGFGLLYIGLLFIRSLYKGLIGGLKTFEKRNDGNKSWPIVILFGLSIGLFLWQLYEVINPIVHNLCVYNTY